MNLSFATAGVFHDLTGIGLVERIDRSDYHVIALLTTIDADKSGFLAGILPDSAAFHHVVGYVIVGCRTPVVGLRTLLYHRATLPDVACYLA